MTEPPEQTLRFLYDHVKEAPERQLADAAALDAKMVQIFGAGSVVIGLTGFTSGQLESGAIVTILLVLAVAAYVAAAMVSVYHLRPRDFWRSIHADVLWTKYWQDPPSEVMHALVENIAGDYAHNRAILASKARSVEMGLAATALEVLLVGSAIAASRLS